MADKKTEALKTIAMLPTPTFTIDGKKYVKWETVQAMKQWAKEALA